ncbi:hypothetical protein OG271_03830 [Micromonospora rifamycinica]|uniref:hypothetical protein n=1 Tax=Micromonospora rifamycinica TaxID=291594 RepID=UPI002E2A7DA9|nr:hypothetical protein [Micromonospora rifamycinica]
MTLLLSTECTRWRAGTPCRSTTGVRPYLTGAACTGCRPAGEPAPQALCRTCGGYLDPAARAGQDGTPDVHDRHPGCEAGGTPLQLIQGGRTA